MHQTKADAFPEAAAAPLSMSGAIARARSEILSVSELPLEGIVSCERAENGGWRVVVELIESAARMGDNDFLAAYELRIGPDGAMAGVARLGRYRREDGGIG